MIDRSTSIGGLLMSVCPYQRQLPPPAVKKIEHGNISLVVAASLGLGGGVLGSYLLYRKWQARRGNASTPSSTVTRETVEGIPLTPEQVFGPLGYPGSPTILPSRGESYPGNYQAPPPPYGEQGTPPGFPLRSPPTSPKSCQVAPPAYGQQGTSPGFPPVSPPTSPNTTQDPQVPPSEEDSKSCQLTETQVETPQGSTIPTNRFVTEPPPVQGSDRLEDIELVREPGDGSSSSSSSRTPSPSPRSSSTSLSSSSRAGHE